MNRRPRMMWLRDDAVFDVLAQVYFLIRPNSREKKRKIVVVDFSVEIDFSNKDEKFAESFFL